MNQAEMIKKICPIMGQSLAGKSTSVLFPFVMCQGSDCMAFNSRPTKIFLAKDGGTTTKWADTRKLHEMKTSTVSFSKDLVDESKEIERLISEGWTKRGVGTGVHMTKEGEPNCWCDAMAGNAQCGYEAP